MSNRISLGCTSLDTLLGGGLETDIITVVYGPASSGKTNLCMLSSLAIIVSGKKVIYVDTEGGFSLERFSQLSPEYEKILSSIIFFRPTSFSEQKLAISQLLKLVSSSIGIIVVDTIANFYRLQLGSDDKIYEVNKDLGFQIQILSQIARNHKIPVLLANQVYAHFEQPNQVKMVGGDFLKYGAKCLIELEKGRGPIRRAILRKHRSLAEGNAVMFRIVETGFAEIQT